jgi:hypothetical protein
MLSPRWCRPHQATRSSLWRLKSSVECNTPANGRRALGSPLVTGVQDHRGTPQPVKDRHGPWGRKDPTERAWGCCPYTLLRPPLRRRSSGPCTPHRGSRGLVCTLLGPRRPRASLGPPALRPVFGLRGPHTTRCAVKQTLSRFQVPFEAGGPLSAGKWIARMGPKRTRRGAQHGRHVAVCC